MRRMVRCSEIVDIIKLIQSHDRNTVMPCQMDNQTALALDRCRNNGCNGQLQGSRQTDRGLRRGDLSVV